MPLQLIVPANYDNQLAEKIARHQQAFAEFGIPAIEVFKSEPLHYRLRAEFRIWRNGGRIDYAMFAADNPRLPVAIETFPAASAAICDLMPRLRERLQASDVLREALFQADFLSTLSGEMLVTLIYRRPLDAAWETAARQLAADLKIMLIGRSRGQKIVLERDWVLERCEVDGRELSYQQFEGSFTQPNGNVNRQMLAWARRQASGTGGDLLELYCGNGNFTVALAPLFDKVLATEVSKSSVHAAEYNLSANGVDNVTIARLSSEEVSEAIAGTRVFNRLSDVDLTAYRFSTVFVDPPRSGLDDLTLELVRGFDRILYISCNPETLRQNVAALQDTHRVVAAAAFDQFPYTHHLEAGLVLQRRQSEN